jgi:hypothetical protein
MTSALRVAGTCRTAGEAADDFERVRAQLCDASRLLNRDFALCKNRLKNRFNFVFSNGDFL